jgi:hypothetical protein
MAPAAKSSWQDGVFHSDIIPALKPTPMRIEY